jgi:hypothetical protein
VARSRNVACAGLMRWCELNGVDYLFGLARNAFDRPFHLRWLIPRAPPVSNPQAAMVGFPGASLCDVQRWHQAGLRCTEG